jgi:hypothetical protein
LILEIPFHLNSKKGDCGRNLQNLLNEVEGNRKIAERARISDCGDEAGNGSVGGY